MPGGVANLTIQTYFLKIRKSNHICASLQLKIQNPNILSMYSEKTKYRDSQKNASNFSLPFLTEIFFVLF